MDNIEERFFQLETKIAYQEHTISELSSSLFALSKKADKTEAELKLVIAKLKDVSEQKEPKMAENERPPHY